MTALAGLVLWTAYVWTLAPTVYVGDSGELTAAACLLGVPHPPGYPLFTWWSHLFTLVPLGSLAFRVNLATAAAGWAAAWIGARVVGAWTSSRVTPLALITLGILPLAWIQSTAAEVYATAGALWASSLWAVRGGGEDDSLPWLSVFTWGLAVASHPAVLLTGPAMMWWWMRRGIKGWSAAAAALTVGLAWTVWAGLPVRALAHPSLAWGETETFRGWLVHVLRLQYGSGSEVRTLASWGRQYLLIGELMLRQTGWLLIPALVGAATGKGRMRGGLLAAAGGVAVGLPILVNFSGDPLSRDLVAMFLFPALLPVSGLAFACWKFRGALVAGLAIWIVWAGVSGWAWADRSRTTVGYLYGRDLLEQTHPGVAAVLEGDNVLFPLSYVRYVEGWPTAGTWWDEAGNVLNQAPEDLLGREGEIRFNVGTRLANRRGAPIGSAGLLLKSGTGVSEIGWRRARLPFGARPPDADYMTRDLTALAWYFFGERHLARGDFLAARFAHERASRIAPENDTVHTNIGNAWLRAGRAEEALAWYARAETVNPWNAANAYNAGYALAELGKTGEAIQAYRRALERDPHSAAAWMGLGMMQARQGREGFEAALASFRRAVHLDPSNPQTHYNLGAVLGNAGRLVEARASFEEALRVDPHFEKARQALAQLR